MFEIAMMNLGLKPIPETPNLRKPRCRIKDANYDVRDANLRRVQHLIKMNTARTVDQLERVTKAMREGANRVNEISKKSGISDRYVRQLLTKLLHSNKVTVRGYPQIWSLVNGC